MPVSYTHLDVYKRQEYCGAVIKNEFYDWQTESFEIYESISTNLKSFLQLLVSGYILFLCVFPVSYTHLDVYKRQMENRQGCIVPQEYFGIRKRRSI